VTRTREIPAREIVFVDPGVSDVETILDHLRPEVEAILLHAARPVAQQIAAGSTAATVFTRSTSSPTVHRVGSASPPATSMLMMF
jgi:hypothetical protein